MSDLTELVWPKLSDDQRRRLEDMASTFGNTGEKLEGMVLPDDREAHGIALEMFTLSQDILREYLEKNDNGRS